MWVDAFTYYWSLSLLPCRLVTNYRRFEGPFCLHFQCSIRRTSRSQWPRGLRRGSAAARLLRLWVRILTGAWMSVCCNCCVLSGRGLCNGLITRPEESYRLWCVVVCDLETSWMRGPWPTGGGLLRQKQRNNTKNELIWRGRHQACKESRKLITNVHDVISQKTLNIHEICLFLFHEIKKVSNMFAAQKFANNYNN